MGRSPDWRCLSHSPLTPAERSLRARLGAFSQHAQHDTRETTKAGREAFLSRFEREVDPEHELSEAERQRRAAAARKADFVGLAVKSSRARSIRKNQHHERSA